MYSTKKVPRTILARVPFCQKWTKGSKCQLNVKTKLLSHSQLQDVTGQIQSYKTLINYDGKRQTTEALGGATPLPHVHFFFICLFFLPLSALCNLFPPPLFPANSKKYIAKDTTAQPL